MEVTLLRKQCEYGNSLLLLGGTVRPSLTEPVVLLNCALCYQASLVLVPFLCTFAYCCILLCNNIDTSMKLKYIHQV
jgi:hypothetical protein